MSDRKDNALQRIYRGIERVLSINVRLQLIENRIRRAVDDDTLLLETHVSDLEADLSNVEQDCTSLENYATEAEGGQA